MICKNCKKKVSCKRIWKCEDYVEECDDYEPNIFVGCEKCEKFDKCILKDRFYPSTCKDYISINEKYFILN